MHGFKELSMDTATKIKLLSITALVAALLGTYFTALHIDSLARERYVSKRRLLVLSFIRGLCNITWLICFILNQEIVIQLSGKI